MADTHVDQSKVVFINGKLFRSNLLFQGRGIGALQEEERKRESQQTFWENNITSLQTHQNNLLVYFLPVYQPGAAVSDTSTLLSTREIIQDPCHLKRVSEHTMCRKAN